MNTETNKKYFQKLFELHDEGRMWVAGSVLRDMGATKDESRELVSYWLNNYKNLAVSLGISVLKGVVIEG